MRTACTLFIALAALAGCKKEEAPAAKAAEAPTPAAPMAAAPAPAPAPAAAAEKTAIATPDIVISTAPADIKKGEEIFAAKGCTACHKMGGGKLVGPDLKGVTARRDQEWIEKMILRPDVMVKEDDEARKMLATHFTPMPNQNVDPASELPFILAYLKAHEK